MSTGIDRDWRGDFSRLTPVSATGNVSDFSDPFFHLCNGSTIASILHSPGTCSDAVTIQLLPCMGHSAFPFSLSFPTRAQSTLLMTQLQPQLRSWDHLSPPMQLCLSRSIGNSP